MKTRASDSTFECSSKRNLTKLSTFADGSANGSMDLDAVIETPRGSGAKFDYDPATDTFTAVRYQHGRAGRKSLASLPDRLRANRAWGSGGRLVRGVAASLTMKVPLELPGSSGEVAGRRPVSRLKTPLSGPGLDQRAVDREMLVRRAGLPRPPEAPR